MIKGAKTRDANGNGVAAGRFVCVFNRHCDEYQVALALEEAGLLECLVTDFYAPGGPVRRVLPRFLRRRSVPGLPPERTRSVLSSFLLQALGQMLRVPMLRMFAFTDALLARAAGRMADQQGQALYCYHNYIPRKIPAGAPLILFVYHPRRKADHAVLVEDARRFPEVARSLQDETLALETHEPPIDWGRPDGVVCASTFTARSVIEDGCDPERITVIPYGAPCPPLAVDPARRDGAARFLFVGQGCQRKGLHHLIRAWQAVPREGAELLIVSYAMDPQIAALIEAPGIRVLGHQSREELDRLFGDADVFVMPSLVEGFGLVYQEALSSGCHLIGTANIGLPDLHLPAGSVTLVDPGDLDDLSAAIDRCITVIGQGGYDRAAIAACAATWIRSDFRTAIADHARSVLENHPRAQLAKTA